LSAKAVAVLTLAKTLTENKCLREECLLSYTMEYSNHASDLAKKLPQDDAARWYVSHDEHRLDEMVLRESATAESRYLRMLQRTKNGEETRNLIDHSFPSGPFSLPIVKIAADLHMVRIGERPVSEILLQDVLTAISRDADMLQTQDTSLGGPQNGENTEEVETSAKKATHSGTTPDTATLIHDYEASLRKASDKFSGPFLDSTTYRAFYNGYFFTVFYDDGLYYLDRLSSLVAAQDFSASLGDLNAGIGGDLKRWYSHLVISKAGEAAPQVLRDTLRDDFAGLQTLGLPPLKRTLKEEWRYADSADPGRLKALRALILHLDSRVSHRCYLSEVARSQMLDIKLHEKLAESILKDCSDGRPEVLAWYANYSGNQELLSQLCFGSA
jgi:hypothetical protein